MPPKIEFSDNIHLHSENKGSFTHILEQMFPDYDQVIVEREFVGSSFSGSWVFHVHLIRDGKKNLPIVVKIASISLIEKEWRAYHKYIDGKWPRATEIETKPVIAQNKKLGGLYYALAGDGVFPVQSLHSYCLEAPVEKIESVLERLARILEHVIIYNSEKSLNFRLRAIYDLILPVNLLIEPGPIPAKAEFVSVSPTALPKTAPDIGIFVSLEGFAVTKVDLKDKTITLDLPPADRGLPDDSYHIRLQFRTIEAMPVYTKGQVITSIEGKVLTTREAQWYNEMTGVMANQDFDLTADTIQLPHSQNLLPNPFTTIYKQDILNQRYDIRVSTIHGDLNLENILVDPDVGVIHLIDFAEAHWGYVLHDLLRLETEVISKLVTPALQQANLPPETIGSFYEQLHYATFQLDADHQPIQPRPPHPTLERAFTILKIIRQIVRGPALFHHRKYDEYYNGLTLYLLGALKFRNLNVPAKQLLFFGAATIQQLLVNPLPKIEDYSVKASPIVTPAQPLSPAVSPPSLRQKNRLKGCVWAGIMLVLLLLAVSLLCFMWLPENLIAYSSGMQFNSKTDRTALETVPQPIQTLPPVVSLSPTKTPQPTLTSPPSPRPGIAQTDLVFGQEGMGPGYFIDPRRIALDGEGNIYIGEWEGNRIQKFDATGNFISLWNTLYDGPVTGLAANQQGTVYVVQRSKLASYNGATGEFQEEIVYNESFHMENTIDLATGKVVTDAVTSTQKRHIHAITIGPDDRLIAISISGQSDHLVKFDAQGSVEQVVDVRAQTGNRFFVSLYMAADGLGNIYVSNHIERAVYKFGPDGQFINKFGSRGEDPGQFRHQPGALAVDAQGRVFVSDIRYIHIFGPDGRFIDFFDTVVYGSIGGMAFNEANQLFVVMHNNYKVVKFVIDE